MIMLKEDYKFHEKCFLVIKDKKHIHVNEPAEILGMRCIHTVKFDIEIICFQIKYCNCEQDFIPINGKIDYRLISKTDYYKEYKNHHTLILKKIHSCKCKST